jgi:phospholipid transport system substrate-binding protein
MKRRLGGFSILFFFFLFSLAAYAGAPLDATRDGVNKVLAVLRDKTLKTAVKKDRLESIYQGMFDEVELSRLSLGRNWNKLNASQQQEFVQLFRKILEKAYADKILSYTDEKIDFYKETVLSSDRAEVRTKVITSSKEIPIFYRLILKNGVWKVYDVVIENVSLVQNYRAQFNDILAKNTTSQLLDILRKKVKSQ